MKTIRPYSNMSIKPFALFLLMVFSIIEPALAKSVSDARQENWLIGCWRADNFWPSNLGPREVRQFDITEESITNSFSHYQLKQKKSGKVLEMKVDGDVVKLSADPEFTSSVLSYGLQPDGLVHFRRTQKNRMAMVRNGLLGDYSAWARCGENEGTRPHPHPLANAKDIDWSMY